VKHTSRKPGASSSDDEDGGGDGADGVAGAEGTVVIERSRNAEGSEGGETA